MQRNYRQSSTPLRLRTNSSYQRMDAQQENISLSNNSYIDDAAAATNGVTNTISSSLKNYCKNTFFIAELLGCALLAGLGTSAPGIIFRISLYERPIPYQQTANGDIILDSYIDRDFTEQQTVPTWFLIVICVVLPYLIILIYSFRFGHVHDVHAGTCAFLFAFGCNEIITNSVKLYCGYWRPNFYNYCGLDEDTMSCEDEGNLSNSRKSFPSGHASSSFCGMTLFTLFFLGKIGLYRSYLHGQWNHNSNSNGNGNNNGGGLNITNMNMDTSTTTSTTGVFNNMDAFKNEDISLFLFKKRMLSILATLPMLVAVFTSASRVHDDMHHPADVVAGTIIGILCSSFSYGLW